MLVADVSARAARLFWICAPLFAVVLWAEPAHAYTWMIRHGYGGCVTCHSDPSGGELLTPYGRVQSDLILRMRYGKDSVSAAASEQSSSGSFDSFDSFDTDSESTGKKAKPEAEDEGEENADEEPGEENADEQKPAKKKPAKRKPDDEEPDEENADEEKPAKKKPAKRKPDDEEPDEENADEEAAGEENADEENADEENAAKKKPDDEEPAEAAPAEGGGGGPSDSSGFLWGLIEPPEWMLLGGSVRVAQSYKESEYDIFPMQLDLYGQLQFGAFRAAGSIGVARVEVGSQHARAAQVTTNQGKEFNLISRTHWLGLDFAEGKYTLRAGRLNLPFGVRIPEHTMWVREKTRTDRESDQQHGLALAFNGSWLRGEIMGIAGNYQINPDEFRERGYSLYLEALASEELALGVSSLFSIAQKDDRTFLDESTQRQVHGLLARAALSREVAVLFEGDVLLRSRTDTGYVGFLQGDLEFVQGLHFLLTGEILDEGFRNGVDRGPGFGEPKFGGWLTLDWFFLPHMEVRVDAIVRQEDPFTLFSQLHVFL